MSFTVRDAFWNKYRTLVADVMLPYEYDALNNSLADASIEKSHSLENIRIAAGESEEEFRGLVFQDSDTAKWLEAVAYSLLYKPNADLEKKADEVIRLIGKAQDEDGYFNTYFKLNRPQSRFTNLLEAHELYCAGHLIEAGVAYFEGTGKRTLLDISRRFADLLYRIFLTEGKKGVPGHPEIELALVRLYRATGEKNYLDLAKHFIDERGTDPDFFVKEAAARDWNVWTPNPKDTDYLQATRPVREEENAVGHAVRAAYLYTGMAMTAHETGDETLLAACKRMWRSIIDRRMYVTGGIGSTAAGEAFTADYDLPNDTNYCETCAAIALIFFAHEMATMTNDAEYADVMERALYNNVLASFQQDGTHFFYVNPLEVDPALAGKIPLLRHVFPSRPGWHACACCPPNAARLLSSIDRYAFHESAGVLYADLFLGGTFDSATAALTVESALPRSGEVTCTLTRGADITLAVRIPSWSKRTVIRRNGEECVPTMQKGYALFQDLNAGDAIAITFDMTPRKIYANPKVAADFGKCAVSVGPRVFCFEDVDQSAPLEGACLKRGGALRLVQSDAGDHGGFYVRAEGTMSQSCDGLYSYHAPDEQPCELIAVPYHIWGNRGLGRMKVWLPER